MNDETMNCSCEIDWTDGTGICQECRGPRDWTLRDMIELDRSTVMLNRGPHALRSLIENKLEVSRLSLEQKLRELGFEVAP